MSYWSQQILGASLWHYIQKRPMQIHTNSRCASESKISHNKYFEKGGTVYEKVHLTHLSEGARYTIYT